MGVLEPEDVRKLTGAGTRQRCIDCLVSNGIRYVVGVDGWPRVYEGWLLDDNQKPKKVESWEPNLD